MKLHKLFRLSGVNGNGTYEILGTFEKEITWDFAFPPIGSVLLLDDGIKITVEDLYIVASTGKTKVLGRTDLSSYEEHKKEAIIKKYENKGWKWKPA